MCTIFWGDLSAHVPLRRCLRASPSRATHRRDPAFAHRTDRHPGFLRPSQSTSFGGHRPPLAGLGFRDPIGVPVIPPFDCIPGPHSLLFNVRFSPNRVCTLILLSRSRVFTRCFSNSADFQGNSVLSFYRGFNMPSYFGSEIAPPVQTHGPLLLSSKAQPWSYFPPPPPKLAHGQGMPYKPGYQMHGWNPLSERVAFYTHPPTITNLASIGGNHRVTRQRFSFISHHRCFIDVFPRTD